MSRPKIYRQNTLVIWIDVENRNIDGLDIIHDSSKTIDPNVEQPEPIVDSDVDRNDVSQKEYPQLQRAP